jgi:predicted  nucleic acid-binding Zn-ribbon protein
MAWFRNYYRCARCAHQWTDEWSATCDDDCPHCGARHMSPYKSDELEVGAEQDTALEPAVPRSEIELRIALGLLKNARDRVRRAQCPRTLRKIRSAIKSAEGAARHLQLRHTTGERR